MTSDFNHTYAPNLAPIFPDCTGVDLRDNTEPVTDQNGVYA